MKARSLLLQELVGVWESKRLAREIAWPQRPDPYGMVTLSHLELTPRSQGVEELACLSQGGGFLPWGSRGGRGGAFYETAQLRVSAPTGTFDLSLFPCSFCGFL